MSKEEALQKVNDIINEKLTSDITIKHGSYETVVNTSQFGIKFNIDKAVNKAYNIGKADNIVVNNYKILLTKLFKTNIEPELIIDNPSGGSRIYSARSRANGTFTDLDQVMYIAPNTDQLSPAPQVHWGDTVIMALRTHEVKHNPFKPDPGLGS